MSRIPNKVLNLVIVGMILLSLNLTSVSVSADEMHRAKLSSTEIGTPNKPIEQQNGITTRVSVSSSGEQWNGGSLYPSISADGRFVAFDSDASNLVSGDTIATTDVFVRDRQTGVTERVSVSSSGVNGNNRSEYSYISADGRFVAFSSDASNLVGGDTNGEGDIFVRDRQNGVTERVSVSSSDEQGNDYSYWSASISVDGRFVAFWGAASNLVSGDTNGAADVFIRDRQSGVTERVSVSSSGEQGNGFSEDPSISADGRFVAFESLASNLVSGDTNGEWDVFVRDRQTGMTERVSVSSSGEQGNDYSFGWPSSISADGRFVAFQSEASNLVNGDTNGKGDIFVRDRQNGVTERVSVSSSGEQGNDNSHLWASISADGLFVAFWSSASNLVSGDTNGEIDVFVRDRQTGVTERVSVSSSGEQGNSYSSFPSISADGRFVAFASQASNLVSGDTNGEWDVFVRDRCPDGSCGVNPCELINLPQYYQGWPSTPDSLPNRPYWFDDTYGKYEDGDTYNTVGLWGCNTTSNAMIVDYFGSCLQAEIDTDPGVLNGWLRSHDGYNDNHWVIYAKVVEFAREAGLGVQFIIDGRDDNRLEQHLENDEPAMLRVSTSYGTHFVVATGKTTIDGYDTFSINDPIWGQTTLYEHYNNEYFATYYYSESSLTGSLMQISALSPTHMVVTDPLGNRAGYDPRSDTTYTEILNAGYVIDEITEPGGHTLEETKVLLIPEPIPGEYQIQAIGYSDGEYSIEVVKLGYVGESIIEEFSGTASLNSEDHYYIDFDPGSKLFLPSILK